MSIGYATATRGGSHHDTRPTMQYRPEFDHSTIDGKAEYAVRSQHYTAVGDSLVLCRFTSERGFGMLLNETFAQMVNGVTGFGLTTEDLERVGERIINLERAFNVREGVRRRMTCCRIASCMNPSPSAPRRAVSPDELDRMLDEFYALRHWSAMACRLGSASWLSLQDVVETMGSNGRNREGH
jgi:aldehyde:ferredoxin oxidoreductase